MTLASGQFPYEVDYIVPFVAEQTIGISGIMLEQAQFLITAERRKFDSNDAHELNDFFVYTNQSNSPSGGYEPKVDGSTLANLLNPGTIATDNILETRDALEDLFADYASITDYEANDHFKDWIQQAFPNSPSGRFDILPASEDPTNDETNFMRPALPFSAGRILDADPFWLGGSGIFFDIDFGEVLFHPYPFLRAAAQRNSVGTLQTLNVVAEPFFPAFHKTDGTVINTTGREPRRDNGTATNLYTDHVASGYIRVNGYGLVPQTQHLLGKFLFGDHTIYPPAHFTHEIFESNDVVYVSPQAIASGVYRASVSNENILVAGAGVPSGYISQHPHPDDSYPQEDNFAETATGFEVFDDCFWLSARANFGNLNGDSLGMSIVSPFTFNFMWTAIANGDWDDYFGLAKDGSSVYRVFPQTSTTSTYDVDTRITIKEWTRGSCTLQNTTTVITTLDIDQQMTLTDIEFDGSFFYISGSSGGGQRSFKLDNSLSVVSTYDTSLGRIFADGSLLYSYVGHQISSMSLTDGSPGTVSFGTAKQIDLTNVDGGLLNGLSFVTIHDIITVNGASNARDGIYALIGQDNSTFIFTQELYILRIEEGVTEWDVLDWVKLTRSGTGFPFTAFIDIDYYDVP